MIGHSYVQVYQRVLRMRWGSATTTLRWLSDPQGLCGLGRPPDLQHGQQAAWRRSQGFYEV